MKVYLDDMRITPEGWHRTYTVKETIELLEKGIVEELSLDNDLGGTDPVHEGREVLDWIEKELIVNDRIPPKKIHIHSANYVAARYMEVVRKNVERIIKEKFCERE